jgi:sugar phosphate permease
MKITAAKVIVTCPGRNFVTLKIVTDQGVYGIGDATLNGREKAVVSYLEDHVVPCMIGPACIGLATSPAMAIALFCVGGFAHQMLNGALITLCSDVFDQRTAGTASGMAGTSAWIGGMLFTLLIGQSADTFGYNPLFVALAGLDLLAAIVLWALLRAPAPELRPAA